jgi:hypothetical protein
MAAPSVDDLARSFERYLRAGNKSPRTIETYLEALGGFAAYLAATSVRLLDRARREDVEAWVAVPARPASRTCTRTCSATPSPTSGSAPAATRST